MFENREWSGVIKKVELDDLTLLWIKRTPKEKGEKPYEYNKEYLEKMSIEDYIKHKKEWVSYVWKNNKDLHEYCKGQFILLREITNPEYRRSKP